MNAEEMLEKAVLGLFVTPAGVNRPSTFLATLYCSLTQRWDESIPTACVTGNMDLIINPTWFATLSDRMRETLLGHELWHIGFMHVDPARVGDRCPDVWNAACDHAINLMMKEHGFHFDNYPPGHSHAGQMMGLADPRFIGMSAEEIYEILIKEGGKPFLPFGNDFQPGSTVPNPDGSSPGNDGQMQPLTPQQLANITAAVVRAATLSRMNSREAGSLPGALVTMIDKLLNPRLPWESLLRRWLTERSAYGSSWRKPSRRFHEIYMPGRTGQEGLAHLRWYLDTSGSVTDAQLKVYNSEVAGAKNTHNPELMTVTSFDTELRDTWAFTEDQNIMGLEFHGRGGTNLEDVMADIRKHRPSAAIIISDLCVDIPKNPGIPILWICVDNPKKRVPYGTIVHLDSKAPSTP
jgi:predicted metal-dependent peptidase